tara:strand:+ start:248 stop:544 length:297 start_codon:yes stop_codon:yes gene_type:complete
MCSFQYALSLKGFNMHQYIIQWQSKTGPDTNLVQRQFMTARTLTQAVIEWCNFFDLNVNDQAQFVINLADDFQVENTFEITLEAIPFHKLREECNKND